MLDIILLSAYFSNKYKITEEIGPAFYNRLMKLYIYNITNEDLGTYNCLAKNSEGETSGEIEIYGKFGLLPVVYPI